MALKYKTFDALMASVEESLSKFADNNLILRKRYIKIVKTCNANLGLKLNKIKERVIPITNGKGNLPEDFFSAVSAFLITTESLGWMYAPILGTWTQEYTKEEIINTGLPFEDYGCINACGTGCYYVTRKYQDKEILYKDIKPLVISESSKPYFCSWSPNYAWNCGSSPYQIDIDSNEITCNFSTGQIYLSYLCDLIDEKGNLLIIDHDLINDYYEWAVKEAILTDIVYNGDADAANLLKDARMMTPIKKNIAVDLICMGENADLKNYNKKIEAEFYNNQVAMFV